MKRYTYLINIFVLCIYILNIVYANNEIPPQPDQPLPNNNNNEELMMISSVSNERSYKSTRKDELANPSNRRGVNSDEDDEEDFEEDQLEDSEGGSNPLLGYRSQDIYFNIIWKCQSKEIFSNDVGYYDLVSVNSKKNCHTYNTPCDEIVSLNITDCPSSQPFNSTCKYILNYFKDTMYCDNTPVLVTDFSCDNFGKHHDIGAIDVVCKKFEQPTERPENSSSISIFNSIINNIQLIVIITIIIYLMV